MKFLLTGEIQRPGGLRLLISLAGFVFLIFEAMTFILGWNHSSPETLTLALEEIHIQFYLRGIEALFLSSIAVTLIDKSWRNVFSAALFLIPVVHAGLVIGCVWFPMICNAVGIFSGMASLLFAVAAVVLVGKLYVR